jgi:thioredoxin-like negative regulator of GroEL
VIGESKRFVCVKLDAEQNGLTLASTYSVHAYPTILVLDRDGCEVDRLEGYCPAPEFIHILRTFENEAAAYRALIEKVKAIPLNKAAAFRLIPMLFKHNKPDDVAALLDRLQKLGQTENMGTYYSELGDVYAKAHRQNELCDAYTKALNFTSDPDIELKAHLALANSYLASGDGINASSHLEWIVNAPNVPDKLKGEARSALSKIKGQ